MLPRQKRWLTEPKAFVKKPELLAPAGDAEKLKIAVHYGADAVYLAGKSFGLRSSAGNFDLEQLREAVDYASSRGVKVYLTVNTYPAGSEFPLLSNYLEAVAAIPFDAYIAADPGVIDLIREISPERQIHLSTQANTVNWRSALFWQRQGVSRINLAREMTLEDIRETRRRVGTELEVFVHGALCISYSGRCLLSSAMSGRNANRGECAHPCRWRYSLVEETRPGEYFPVEEEDGGTFIFNSRDLCLLPHLRELVEAGVDSLKIEGRMKGIHYLAVAVRVYREALDRLAESPDHFRPDPRWLEELRTVSHRGYTTGFLFGAPREVGQEYDSRYLRHYDIVGLVEGIAPDGSAVVGVRNRCSAGDTLELYSPAGPSTRFPLQGITDAAGTPVAVAHPNSTIRVRLPVPAAPLDILRRPKEIA
jgi:U32 family peptidase